MNRASTHRTRSLHSLSVLALLTSSLAPPRAAACMIAAREPVVVEGEESLIVWDDANRKEYFIRRADFRGARSPFGFVVPTPGRPALSEVDDAIFTRLARLYTAPMPRSAGDGTRGGALRNAPQAAPAVQVVERTRVAGLDATVLLATDAAALARWLRRHGLPAPSGMTAWLAPYVARGYYVTAFRYDPARSRGRAFGSRAVMMAFDTERAYFPYSEPQGAPSASGRRFRVSVISRARMQGRVGGSPWGARVGFAGATGAVHGLLPRQLPPRILPDAPWVTTFDETSGARGADDLWFERATDQSPVPPSITERVAP